MSFPLVIQTDNHTKKLCITHAWNRQCIEDNKKKNKGGETQNENVIKYIDKYIKKLARF
jgi:hypothetical protein